MHLNKFIVFPADYAPLVTQQDAANLFNTQKELLEDFLKNQDKMSFEDWLEETIKQRFASADRITIKQETTIILETLRKGEEKEKARKIYQENGLDSVAWMTQELMDHTKDMAPEQAQLYLENMAQQVDETNRINLNVCNAAERLLAYKKEGQSALKMLPSLQIGACAMVERFNQEPETKLLGYHAVLDEKAVSDKLPYGMIKIYDRNDKQIDAYGITYLPYKGPLLEDNAQRASKKLSLLNTKRELANSVISSSQVAVGSNAKALHAVLGFDKVEAQCLIDELAKQIGFEEIPDFEFRDAIVEDIPETPIPAQTSAPTQAQAQNLPQTAVAGQAKAEPNIARIGYKLKLADHEDVGVFNDLPKASSLAQMLDPVEDLEKFQAEAAAQDSLYADPQYEPQAEPQVKPQAKQQAEPQSNSTALAVLPLPEESVITEDMTDREPVAEYYDRPADPEFIEHLNQQTWFKAPYTENSVLTCLGGQSVPYANWNEQVKRNRAKEIAQAIKEGDILSAYIYPTMNITKNILLHGFKMVDSCVNFIFNSLAKGTTLILKVVTTLAVALGSVALQGFDKLDFQKSAMIAENAIDTLAKVMDEAALLLSQAASKGLYYAGKAASEVLASKVSSTLVGMLVGAHFGPLCPIIGGMIGIALSSLADKLFEESVGKVLINDAENKRRQLNSKRVERKARKEEQLNTNKNFDYNEAAYNREHAYAY